MTINGPAVALAPNTVPVIPRVVDVFHGDVFASDVKKSPSLLIDMQTLITNGIWGIIHKATQGIGNTDGQFKKRMAAAKEIGLLCMGYHFNTGENIASQIDHFWEAAEPDAEMGMCLDWEDNRASQMTLSEFIQFCNLADEKLGRPIWVYSGNRAKTLLTDPSKEIRDCCAKRHLWGCQYGSRFISKDNNGKLLPFKDVPLWQYTGDGLGPKPHSMPGIVTQGIDLNHFAGTKENLKTLWLS